MRSSLKIVAGLLLVGASSLAIAQEVRDRSARDSFGADVSARAKAQRDGETRGIGSEVSVLARQQGELRRGAADGDDGPDDEIDGPDDDVEDDVDSGDEAGASQGIGAEVSALARGQRESEEKGLGEQVRAMTPAATRSNRPDRAERSARRAERANARADAEAVAAARGGNREIRGGAGAVADLRASVANTRTQAAAARREARSAAQQARQVRETVRAARRGRGG